MLREIECPLCNGGKLKINVANGYDIVTSGAMSELPCICICKNCNRKVIYKIVNQEK